MTTVYPSNMLERQKARPDACGLASAAGAYHPTRRPPLRAARYWCQMPETACLHWDDEDTRPLDEPLGGAVTYRIAMGPQLGQKAFTLQAHSKLARLPWSRTRNPRSASRVQARITSIAEFARCSERRPRSTLAARAAGTFAASRPIPMLVLVMRNVRPDRSGTSSYVIPSLVGLPASSGRVSDCRRGRRYTAPLTDR